MEVCRHPDVVVRPLAGQAITLTTYLLRPDINPPVQLSHFIDRVNPFEAPVQSGPP
jgi:hypothetical protein